MNGATVFEKSDSPRRVAIMVRGRGSGAGFAVGGILVMLMTTYMQTVYPTFSTRSDAISTLGGAGAPTAIFWNTAMVVAGLLWLYASYRLFHGSGRPLSSIPFYLSGAGFVLVGISPWNTLPLTHTIGAQLVFFFGAIACLVSWRLVRGAIGAISLFSGLISFLAFLGSMHGLDNVFGTGGVERMLYYPILLWEIAFGGYLISLGEKL